MIRLNRTDFDDRKELAKYAAICGITPEQFYDEFHYLVEQNLLYTFQDQEDQRSTGIEKIKVPF
jgi:hypothetical protein